LRSSRIYAVERFWKGLVTGARFDVWLSRRVRVVGNLGRRNCETIARAADIDKRGRDSDDVTTGVVTKVN
jgi:hypothetical protein